MKPAFVLALLTTVQPLLAGLVSLTDNFDDASLPWTVTGGQWHMEAGRYRVVGTGDTYVQGMVFGDVTVEVDCRITDYGAMVADWVGVVVGADQRTGWGSGYLAYVRYSGDVELYREGKIVAMQPGAARGRFEAGQSVRLGVTVAGRHLTVSLEGQRLMTWEAPAPVRGSVGLAAFDVHADFDNLILRGERLSNMITGEVLALPSYTPVAGARVEIYNSMDGYNSPVTCQTTSDEQGRFVFSDLPTGEKAYWLRAGKSGYGATTAWFVSVTDSAPTSVELQVVGAPPHDIWLDSSMASVGPGFRPVDDIQCFGGARLELKELRPVGKPAHFRMEIPFQVAREGDYVPHFAAGLYPSPHYWSDFWWALDGHGPYLASKTLTLEGPRYGDRSTLVWAYAPVQHLRPGRHTLNFVVRDPAPHQRTDRQAAYWWSFDAAALTEVPTMLSPVGGRQVATPRPKLTWRAPASAARFTVQLSHEPDFSNGTLTIGGLAEPHLALSRPLADGVYYWRVKALGEEETPFACPFTRAERFIVATDAPAIMNVRVLSRGATEAEIAWETDEPCRSLLRYGLSTTELTGTASAATPPGTQHRVRLTRLQPMTYYYYAAESSDQQGHVSTSLRRGFCTSRGIIGDRNSPFGIFGQGLTYARALGQAGARWYSDYWDWATIEPARGTFNWDQPEQRMKRAAEAGVNLTVTFWGTPPWARPSRPKFTYGPDDFQDARDFFREVAAHCKGRVEWWLPWIEPNVARDPVFGFPEGYWANRPHARTYAAYQRAAYQGAKAGNPDCRAVGMNTAGVDLDFIRKCYDEGAAEDFDVMNVHYYAMTEPFERQNPEAIFASLRALMSQYGDSEKPIMCSEGGGFSSGLPGTDEDKQADNIIRIFVISIANNIDKLCWTFELDEKPYGSQRLDMIMWMGLFRFDPRTTPENPVGEPKPSYFAFRTMTEQLTATEYVGPVELGPGLRAYRFQGPDRRVTVAWAEQGRLGAKLPVTAPEVGVIRRDGSRSFRNTRDGAIALVLTESPVFVREAWHR